MPNFTSQHLERVAAAVLDGAGTPSDLAELVAHSLVESNLVGHDSHGVMRLRQYTSMAASGQVQPAARAIVSHTFGATAVVDGLFGWGQPAAQLATRTAGELAESYGVAAVTISNCNHVGRLGEYVETLARGGLVGMALCNTDAAVAPFGGRTRMLGTNPIAYAVPAAMATIPSWSISRPRAWPRANFGSRGPKARPSRSVWSSTRMANHRESRAHTTTAARFCRSEGIRALA